MRGRGGKWGPSKTTFFVSFFVCACVCALQPLFISIKKISCIVLSMIIFTHFWMIYTKKKPTTCRMWSIGIYKMFFQRLIDSLGT